MRVEPSANVRQAARALREMYVALREQGFGVEEATVVIAAVAQTMVQGASDE